MVPHHYDLHLIKFILPPSQNRFRYRPIEQSGIHKKLSLCFLSISQKKNYFTHFIYFRIHRKYSNMDILDQLASSQNNKGKKNALNSQTSKNIDPLQSKYNHRISANTKLGQGNRFDPFNFKNEESFSKQKDQSQKTLQNHPSISSYESVGSHFTIQRQSRKKTGKDLTSQLGIILSEEDDSSRPEKSEKGKNLRRRSSINPIQQEQLNEEISNLNKQFFDSQLKNKELTQKIKIKQEELSDMKKQLNQYKQKESLERRKIIEECSQNLQKERKRLTANFEEEVSRKESLFKWEFQSKQKMYKQNIEFLQRSVQQYKDFIAEKTCPTQIENLNRQQNNSNYDPVKIKLDERQRFLNEQERRLSREFDQLWQMKADEKKKIERQNDYLQQKNEKQRKELKEQKNRILELEEKAHKQKIEGLREIERSKKIIENEKDEIRLIRSSLDQQKQRSKELQEKFMRQFRLRSEELAEEKAKVYELEAELMKKISIVEQYSQKQPILEAKQNFSKKDIPPPNDQPWKMDSPTRVQSKFDKYQKSANSKSSVNLTVHKTESSPKIMKNHSKINLGNYLLKLDKTRPIYRLQEFYKN